jgi:MFS family permease
MSSSGPNEEEGRALALTHGSRWPFRAVAVPLAVSAAAAGIPTPVYHFYELEFHFGPAVLALIFAVYAAGVLTTMFLVAPLADAIGHRPVLLIGMALTAVAALLFLFATGVPGIALARVVTGLAVGATTSTATASMACLEPTADQHHVARVSVAANFGGVAIGIVASGLLVTYAPDPTHTVYWFLLAASGVGALAVLATPETVPVEERAKRIHLHGLRVPPEDRIPFWVSAGALGATYSLYGFFAAMAPTFVREDLLVQNPAAVAGIVSIFFGVAAASQLALAEVRDRRALLIGLPLLVLAMLLLLVSIWATSLPGLLLGAALLGVGGGCAYMGAVTLIDRVAPDDVRSEVLAAFFVVGYGALSIPTVGIGSAAEAFGLSTAALAFGGALTVVTLALYLVLRRTPTPAGGEGRPRKPRGRPTG